MLDLIRGLDVAAADEVLQFTDRDIARDVRKVLASAVANAVHNDEQDADELFVIACFADEGPTLRRFRPRARGRATRIRKRTCHITVIVARMSDERLEVVQARQAARRRPPAAVARTSAAPPAAAPASSAAASRPPAPTRRRRRPTRRDRLDDTTTAEPTTQDVVDTHRRDSPPTSRPKSPTTDEVDRRGRGTESPTRPTPTTTIDARSKSTESRCDTRRRGKRRHDETPRPPTSRRQQTTRREVMGQKINPYGFRLGVTTDWKTRWFSEREYKEYLTEDWKIRRDDHDEARVGCHQPDRGRAHP